MADPRQYGTAGAFRAALEIRLLERSRREAVDLQRLRRQVAFDRLLARMFHSRQSARGWVLKGGYALEMRFHQARSTKDIDLTVRTGANRTHPTDHSPTALRERLQLAAFVRIPDFFTFVVGEPTLELDQAPEGGSRFPVDARLDGRTFAKFHVDLGAGDDVLEPLEMVVGHDWLGFAGIRRARRGLRHGAHSHHGTRSGRCLLAGASGRLMVWRPTAAPRPDGFAGYHEGRCQQRRCPNRCVDTTHGDSHRHEP
jgi:hypothetical protein